MSAASRRRHAVPAALVAGALAVAAIGCGAGAVDVTGSGPASTSEGGAPGSVVAVDVAADGSAVLATDADAIEVLDPSTGAPRFRVPGGIASRDGSTVAGVETGTGGTTVVVRSTGDGATRWREEVDGAWRLAGVSRDGDAVALRDPDDGDGRTSLVVVRFELPTATGVAWRERGDIPALPVDRPPAMPGTRRYDLPGRVEVDAFDDAGTWLFVLQRSAADPDSYKVRMLDLQSGEVHDMANRDKIVPEGEMYGRARSAVDSPTRGELATLYTIPGSPGTAFVHLLNVRNAYADCLDLPATMGRGDPSTLAIAMPASGKPLFVLDTDAGTVAALDPDLEGSTVTFGAPPELERGRAAAAAVDGAGRLLLASGDRVVTFDLVAGTTVLTWPAGGSVTDLAVVPGTSTIAAVVDGRVRLFGALGEALGAIAGDPVTSTATTPAGDDPEATPPTTATTTTAGPGPTTTTGTGSGPPGTRPPGSSPPAG